MASTVSRRAWFLGTTVHERQRSPWRGRRIRRDFEHCAWQGHCSTTYGYAYPYPVAVHPCPPPAPNSVAVAPGASGGVSFEISLSDAVIMIDGAYVGIASTFSPAAEPLTLAPGTHRIEVRAPGYQSMAYDVNVIPGQVVPYQGTLQPLQR